MIDVLQALLDSRVEVQKGALIVVVVAAFRWGAGPERGTAAVFLYLLFADSAYHAIFGPGAELLKIDIGHALIDASAALAMAAIAVQANRMYTLWIAALQIIAVQSHVARDLESGISPLAYAIVRYAPFYFQIVLLAVGTWLHRKRVRTFGSYRSWRTSSARSRALARPSSPNG